MKWKLALTALLAGLVLAPWTGVAFADSSDAECVVPERGEPPIKMGDLPTAYCMTDPE